MACCVAFGCSNRAGTPDISFYRFPTEQERRKQWINVIRREGWAPTEHSRICSQHFVSGNKSNNPLSPDYVPSIFSYLTAAEKEKQITKKENYDRRMGAKKRKLENVKRKTVADALLELSLSDNTVENSIEGIPSEYCEPNIPENESNAASDHNTESVLQKGENNHKNSISLQTTLTMADIDALENVASYNLTKNRELHEKISNLELSEDSFKSNPDKVRVFTGLANFAILMTVFNLVSPQLKHHANTVLSPFQQLLVTLMRLRLNVPVQFLSYIFHVHYSTIVRTFANVIHVLHDKLVPLTLIWPDTEALRKTLPYVFKVTFPKCVSIIDCFEIFIERPSNLDSKAQTYSNYKSHNTVKYLISISPQGFVNFISKGRGGRTSDKQITEQSGYLNKLFPGDTVLADRGFTIQDSVGSYGASLEIPAFTRGKNQLEALEVIRTRNLASVRIHVERVIGNIRRKYPILDNKVPIKLLLSDETTTLTSLDKIVQVACGLTNICGSVVPFD